MPAPITKVSDQPEAPIGSPLASRVWPLTKRWTVVSLVGILLTLTVIAFLIDGFVSRSMSEGNRQSLQAILDARVTAVNLWIDDRITNVQRLSTDGLLAKSKEQLQKPTAAGSASLSEELNQSIRDAFPTERVAWCLMHADGKIALCCEEASLGRSFTLTQESLDRVHQGRPFVAFPNTSTSDQPWLLAIHPVSPGISFDGSLVLLHDLRAGFTQVVSNESDDPAQRQSFALNRSGVLLTKSPHESLLIERGVLATGQSSALNVLVADGNADTSSRKLSFLADQATRRSRGVNVEGYTDYLGRDVIGAWQWLPEHDFAIATEITFDSAYAGLTTLRRLFFGGLLAFFAIVLLLYLLEKTGVLKTSTATEKLLRRRLGQYTIGGEIGHGGMGTVFHGQHQLLQRDVAVKVLEQSKATDRAMSRFEREVQMTAKLRHPNTIEIYDYGKTPDGTFFYVMEYVRGISLQELVDHYGRQPAERVIYLLLQICGSICEAHKFGMVHRDIKPANLLVTTQAGLHDLVKVLDFGLVKELNRETVDAPVTRMGSVTGTPLYMSPESVRDASKSDYRSDLYSIGAVGYTLLTGLPTFEATTSADICVLQLNQEPIRPSKRIGQHIADDLQNLLMSCLRKNPEERPSSVSELADTLAQCEDAQSWTQADACQWWEQVYEGPRDESASFGDNQPGGLKATAAKKAAGVITDQGTKDDNDDTANGSLPESNNETA